MSVRRMYFVELHPSRSGYRVAFPGILNTPATTTTTTTTTTTLLNQIIIDNDWPTPKVS